MLSPAPRKRSWARRCARDERGFTLVETMVALMTGMIVTGALFSILEVSMHRSSRQADVAQASQLGRLAMTKVVDPLHSACLAAGFPPVQAGSTASKLIVIDGYSEGTEFSGAATSKEGARRDTFYWTELSKGKGKLWDSTELAASGAPPVIQGGASTFTWKSPSTVMIAENVKAGEEEVAGKKVAVPFFRYYKYASKSTTGTAEASSTLQEVTPPSAGFSTTEANAVASVQPAFQFLPANGYEAEGRAVNLTGQVTFAFSAPSTEATIEAGPCE